MDKERKDISVIDKYQSTPTYAISKGQKYVYLFMDILVFQIMIRKLGFIFSNKKKQFLPFKAFNIRGGEWIKCKAIWKS